jgi:hypothetical protein
MGGQVGRAVGKFQRAAGRRSIERLAVRLNEAQGRGDGGHHRPRGDRGAGELVEVAAIAPHPPAWPRRVLQPAPVEGVDPVAAAALDAVAQPRRLLMGQHPHADHAPVAVDAHQEADRSAVAAWRRGLDDQLDRFPVAARPPHRGRPVPAQPGRGLHRDAVRQRVVVPGAGRHDVGQRLQPGGTLGLGDAGGGQVRDGGEQADPQQGDQAQQQPRLQRIAQRGIHDGSPRRGGLRGSP